MKGRGTPGQMPQEVKNGKFLQLDDGWTVGANWAWDKATVPGLLHETGAIEAVSQDLTGATHTTITYEVTATVIGMTAGTLTMKMGAGDTGEIFTEDATANVVIVMTTDTVLSFTPTTDFDGLLTAVSVRELKKQP